MNYISSFRAGVSSHHLMRANSVNLFSDWNHFGGLELATVGDFYTVEIMYTHMHTHITNQCPFPFGKPDVKHISAHVWFCMKETNTWILFFILLNEVVICIWVKDVWTTASALAKEQKQLFLLCYVSRYTETRRELIEPRKNLVFQIATILHFVGSWKLQMFRCWLVVELAKIVR